MHAVIIFSVFRNYPADTYNSCKCI